MIEGGWDFVFGAYVVAIGSLAVLTIVVLARLRSWSQRAGELNKPR